MSGYVQFDMSELLEWPKRVRKDLNDSHKAMPAIAAALEFEVEEVFLKQGAVADKPRWKDLADSTKRQRRGTAPYEILTDTAVMRNSIATYFGDAFVEAFTDVPYFKYHASSLPRKVIPLRDPFDIDQEALQQEVTDILLQFFKRRQ